MLSMKISHINVGYGKEISIIELANLIKKLLDMKVILSLTLRCRMERCKKVGLLLFKDIRMGTIYKF